MVKKLVALEPRVAGLVDYSDRDILENEVLIQVYYASPKHGTEIHDFRGISPFIDEEFDTEWNLFMPRKTEQKGIIFGEFQLGNMIVGKIIKKGTEVVDYEVGEVVATYGPIQETLITKAVDNYKLRKLNSLNQWKNAVCYDPAQFAMGATREANIRTGDYVAIFGLGAIGQIAIQIAKNAGASIIIGIDPIEKRRNLAEEFGATHTFDPTKEDIGFKIKEATNKMGVDSVIELSGVDSALQAALRGLAYGGTISYAAFAHPFKNLDFGREAHFNNAKIVFARASSEPNPDYPRWNRKRIEETCWEELMNGYLDCEKIIDPIVPFVESARAYEQFVDKEPHLSIKLGVDFELEKEK